MLESATKPYVIFLEGIKDDRFIKVNQWLSPSQFSYSLGGGSRLVLPYLKTPQFEIEQKILDASPETHFSYKRVPDVVFNQIWNPHTQRISLRKAALLEQNLAGQTRFLNSASRVMQTDRDQIAALLQDIEGVIFPKTYRFQPESPQEVLAAIQRYELDFPVLFREVGMHKGSFIARFDSETDVLNAHAFAYDKRDYFLIEFLDYPHQDVYRKWRIAMIDGHPYIHHIRYLDHWMVQVGTSPEFMHNNPQYIEAERQIMENFESEYLPVLTTRLQKIHQAIGLEYLGIDCDLNEAGQLIVYETNPNMLFLNIRDKTTRRYEPYIARIRQAIIDMIAQAAKG